MVRWRRRASSARYGVGATAPTLRRLELGRVLLTSLPHSRHARNGMARPIVAPLNPALASVVVNSVSDPSDAPGDACP